MKAKIQGKIVSKISQIFTKEDSNEDFLKRAYTIILNREVDSEGLSNWSKMLDKGLARHDLVRELIASTEFSQKVMSRYSPEFWNSIHKVRSEMVQTLLPQAKTILDLGGANPGDPIGALLSFGYPYLPEKLFIVDLPPNERIIPISESTTKLMHKSCEIEYVYTNMADLSQFKEGYFDLIWSGESIEHVSREDAEQVFLQVYKLLKPNGVFALDTPNRRVTQLQCPYGYIHPEHKLEYYYDELIEILNDYNFEIIQTKGLIELPQSIKTSTFIVDEVSQNLSLNNNPKNSYMFYIACMRSNI
ncbi:DUF4214 domain-containing protein [Nostoc punctiforme UO1]|uniref:methyltransferase domain-containing protein n=1 Tax=Nostoc punctiforme TaxID=272131 RepID=UPI0030A9B9E7